MHRNLLIILAHGLRSDASGDNPNWPLVAPNMDALAQHGMRLIATTASPSDYGGQVSLLTGLHARQHGYLDATRRPVAVEGWPAWMRAQGYHLAGVGCITAIEAWMDSAVYVENVELAEKAGRGCAYLRAMQDKGYLAAIAQQRKQKMRCGPFEPDRLLLDPEDDIDGFIAAEGCRMLERLPTDRHWAQVVMFSGPGNDLPPPCAYDSIVNAADLEADFAVADFTQIDALAELDYPRSMLQRMDPGRLGRIRADYLGRVSLIDHGIGRLMKQLEQRQDREKTWVVLCSDRGHLLGEHGLLGHRSFLAPAVEVPVILAPPTPSPRTEPQECLVSTVDVAGTIAALAACDVPDATVGRSLLSLLADEDFRPATGGVCLSEFSHRLMMETDRHRVIFNTATQRCIALYDLINDPRETRNLVQSPVGRNILDALRWRVGDALMAVRAQPR